MPSYKGGLYKRGRIWWLSVYDRNGRRQRVSTGSSSKREARAQLHALLASAASAASAASELRGPQPSRAGPTLAEALNTLTEEYKLLGRRSQGRLSSARKHLERALPTRADLSGEQLRAYVRQRVAEGARQATVKYELAMLRRSLRLLLASDRLERVPVFPTLRAGEPRQVYVSDEDHALILAELPGASAVRQLCEFLYWTGWRVGSRPGAGALSLEWSGVDWGAQTLSAAGESLTKRAGLYAWSAGDAVETVLESLLGRNERWVFAHSDGRRLGYKLALREFKAAQPLAGLRCTYQLHDYRRSVARRLEQASVPRSTAMRITGHRTERIFRQYAISEDEDVRRALARAVSHTFSHTPGIEPTPVHRTGGETPRS